MLLLSVTLSYAQFLPLIWVAIVVGSMLLVIILGASSPSRYRWRPGMARRLVRMLLNQPVRGRGGGLGLQAWIGSVNSVTAALASSLLATMAIAVQMRQEHQQRIQAQAEPCKHSWRDAAGAVHAGSGGPLIAANPALHAALGPTVLARGNNHWDHIASMDWLRMLVKEPPAGQMSWRRQARARGAPFSGEGLAPGARVEGSAADDRALAGHGAPAIPGPP